MLKDLEIKSDIIELKFQGNEISAQKLTNSEIAELLVAFEKSIIGIVQKEYPAISLKDFDGLNYYNIEHRSLSLKSLVTKNKDNVKEAVLAIASAANDFAYDELPQVTRQNLEKIKKLAAKYHCEARIGYSNQEEFIELATLKYSEKSKFSSFKQTDQIYGRLISIQSDVNKTATGSIRQVNGKIIQFDLSGDEVKEYRQHLSEEVKATGQATICGKTLKTTYFELQTLIPYKLLSLEETVAAIRNSFTNQIP